MKDYFRCKLSDISPYRRLVFKGHIVYDLSSDGGFDYLLGKKTSSLSEGCFCVDHNDTGSYRRRLSSSIDLNAHNHVE